MNDYGRGGPPNLAESKGVKLMNTDMATKAHPGGGPKPGGGGIGIPGKPGGRGGKPGIPGGGGMPGIPPNGMEGPPAKGYVLIKVY